MRVQPVAVQCLQPSSPAAWIMQPYAPNLTQRMLNELSPPPAKAIAG
ncbi:lysis system o-spanin lipoprotein Rz1 [Pseudomonas sp. 3-2]|nr:MULTISPECIES: lysis system o-spanin lipoprotein Rz1 [unclassified Pseudomonas]QZD68760.1 lysis system o-spanin lipoprotein Rz1 [Pseudomonas sp. 3-2]